MADAADAAQPTTRAAPARNRIPFWAMAAVSLLPVWAFMYVRALTPAGANQTGPLAAGADVYGDCAACHGATGQGGVGRALGDGEVLATFPHIEDHVRFVYFGTEAYTAAGVAVYGDPRRAGGPHLAGSFGVMPPQGALGGGGLTDAEIVAVVCHERYGLAGADPRAAEHAEEFEQWCAPDSPVYAAVLRGVEIADLDETVLSDAEGEPIAVLDIGRQPAAGSAAD